jgi:hypothetical protein
VPLIQACGDFIVGVEPKRPPVASGNSQTFRNQAIGDTSPSCRLTNIDEAETTSFGIVQKWVSANCRHRYELTSFQSQEQGLTRADERSGMPDRVQVGSPNVT